MPKIEKIFMDITKYISKKIEPYLNYPLDFPENLEVELRLGNNRL
jgi:hypothetical protein